MRSGVIAELNYDKETDSLYMDLSSRACANSQEIAQDVVMDFDADGQIVGIDIQHASTKLNLNSFEVDRSQP
jgi:uncharacterized protein YuzE